MDQSLKGSQVGTWPALHGHLRAYEFAARRHYTYRSGACRRSRQSGMKALQGLYPRGQRGFGSLARMEAWRVSARR
jgi:hypothetical protein